MIPLGYNGLSNHHPKITLIQNRKLHVLFGENSPFIKVCERNFSPIGASEGFRKSSGLNSLPLRSKKLEYVRLPSALIRTTVKFTNKLIFHHWVYILDIH